MNHLMTRLTLCLHCTLPLLLTLVCFGSVGLADESFLKAPAHVGAPLPKDHAVTNRAFQGIPSLAVAPGGRMWVNWYAGITPGEDHNNYVAVSTSGDGGATWKEVLIVDPDGSGPVRAYDPELWMAPDGRLFVFWAQAVGHGGSIAGVWCVSTDQPDSENPTWSKPQRLTDGIMMCKPTVLSSGEWVLPASTWRETDESARMIVSEDEGKTWALRGACNVPVKDRQFDEHMFVERKDGSLWMLVRTNYGIGESVSKDRGKTWPELTPSTIQHPSARFFVRRLASGNLLLVKHGPVDRRTGRSHLMAFVSSDDGASWGGGLLLDERGGVSYPDGQQTADGMIHIVYDFSRTDARQILTAHFREQDVAAGRDVSGDVRLRQVVSQASGGKEKPPVTVRANPDGVPLSKSKPGQWAGGSFAAQPFVGGVDLFTDRSYTAAELPTGLPEVSFLKVPLVGEKTVTCETAGTVWFLTPAPDRNRDSQSKRLIEQGFRVVAVPEIRLFDPKSPANFCTLYQKDCSKGETIKFGKWAVPVFYR
ncbi:BNR/Asp-box repeat protein [Rosistilla carotiformis]|uniref:BNR/Asp-box repeat protein n=1 Tax=Rosistilla carotiformis TaxID=2528017 RepID=A0A518JNG1_9BACT|nr:sialidase family protein [Rosistilla carotiformis]QDV67051.1 BNR/Asp-box repeat protein [Rosistilla carotiformis]